VSGHSHWATIRHKKAALDARRGKAWSKHARAITMAAKLGGGVPDDNPRLRLAMDKARSDNMPKDTIEKAIKKGTGELEGVNYEDVVYEGYGPGGTAVMAKAMTDNRNRTAGEIKKLFERAGGNLGSPNCVAFQFQQKGVILIEGEKVGEERIMEVALEAGAEDVLSDPMAHEVRTPPELFESVRDAIQKAGVEIQSADMRMVSMNEITLDLETARKAMRLIDALEEHDDVDAVYSNVDIPNEVAALLAKE